MKKYDSPKNILDLTIDQLASSYVTGVGRAQKLYSDRFYHHLIHGIDQAGYDYRRSKSVGGKKGGKKRSASSTWSARPDKTRRIRANTGYDHK